MRCEDDGMVTKVLGGVLPWITNYPGPRTFINDSLITAHFEGRPVRAAHMSPDPSKAHFGFHVVFFQYASAPSPSAAEARSLIRLFEGRDATCLRKASFTVLPSITEITHGRTMKRKLTSPSSPSYSPCRLQGCKKTAAILPNGLLSALRPTSTRSHGTNFTQRVRHQP